MSAGGKGTETDIQWDIGDGTFFCRLRFRYRVEMLLLFTSEIPSACLELCFLAVGTAVLLVLLE